MSEKGGSRLLIGAVSLLLVVCLLLATCFRRKPKETFIVSEGFDGVAAVYYEVSGVNAMLFEGTDRKGYTYREAAPGIFCAPITRPWGEISQDAFEVVNENGERFQWVQYRQGTNAIILYTDSIWTVDRTADYIEENRSLCGGGDLFD